jgi:hypothetical protein
VTATQYEVEHVFARAPVAVALSRECLSVSRPSAGGHRTRPPPPCEARCSAGDQLGEELLLERRRVIFSSVAVPYENGLRVDEGVSPPARAPRATNARCARPPPCVGRACDRIRKCRLLNSADRSAPPRKGPGARPARSDVGPPLPCLHLQEMTWARPIRCEVLSGSVPGSPSCRPGGIHFTVCRSGCTRSIDRPDRSYG